MITPLQRWFLLDDANIGKNFEKSTYFYKKNFQKIFFLSKKNRYFAVKH